MLAVWIAVSGVTAEPSLKLLEKAPTMQLTAVQNADQVQQCIGLALESIGRPNVFRAEGVRYLTFGSKGHSPVLISVLEKNPVQIEVRQSFIFNRKWRNRVRFCAG